MTSIQDGITVNFAPASRYLLPKGWDSPDVTPAMLTAVAKKVADPKREWPDETIRQDACHILIKLAQTTPESFDDAWSYTTGYITNCKEAVLWMAANQIYGSQWTWKHAKYLPKPAPKSQQQKNRVRIPKPTFQTISGVRGRFLARRGGQQAQSSEHSVSATALEAPRHYQTFFTMISPPVTAAGTGPAEIQIVEKFNLAMEMLLDADKTLVIYVWPLKFYLNKSVQPYSKKKLDESYTKATKIESKNELLRYVSSAYTAEGQKCYLKTYCSHNEPPSDLISDTVCQAFQDLQMNIYTETLQAAISMTCGWLLGAETKSFNYDHFTDLLNSLPKFAKLPVACKKRTLKTTKGEVTRHGEGLSAIAILCNAGYRNETNIALKATFNRSTAKANSERPDGTSFKYIEYYADSKSKTGTHDQLKLAKKAMVKQEGWSENARNIRIDGINNLDYPIDLPNPFSTPTIPLPDIAMTCRKIILSLKCQSNYECTLFNKIHEQRDKSIIGVCHSDQHAEAEMVLDHLQALLKEKYGSKIEAWFSQQAIDSAVGYSFCPKTGQVTHDEDEEEEDIFEGFCTSTSPALTANARASGTPIEDDYDGNIDDIDSDDGNEPALKIDMQIMFNISNLGDGGGFDDGHSVGTQMTAVLNATNFINQIGGSLTNTEDELSTVTTTEIPGGQSTSTTTTPQRTQTTTNNADNSASMQQTGVQNDNQ